MHLDRVLVAGVGLCHERVVARWRHRGVVGKVSQVRVDAHHDLSRARRVHHVAGVEVRQRLERDERQLQTGAVVEMHHVHDVAREHGPVAEAVRVVAQASRNHPSRRRLRITITTTTTTTTTTDSRGTDHQRSLQQAPLLKVRLVRSLEHAKVRAAPRLERDGARQLARRQVGVERERLGEGRPLQMESNVNQLADLVRRFTITRGTGIGIGIGIAGTAGTVSGRNARSHAQGAIERDRPPAHGTIAPEPQACGCHVGQLRFIVLAVGVGVGVDGPIVLVRESVAIRGLGAVARRAR